MTKSNSSNQNAIKCLCCLRAIVGNGQIKLILLSNKRTALNNVITYMVVLQINSILCFCLMFIR